MNVTPDEDTRTLASKNADCWCFGQLRGFWSLGGILAGSTYCDTPNQYWLLCTRARGPLAPIPSSTAFLESFSVVPVFSLHFRQTWTTSGHPIEHRLFENSSLVLVVAVDSSADQGITHSDSSGRISKTADVNARQFVSLSVPADLPHHSRISADALRLVKSHDRLKLMP